eukprot:TRINITY_DN24614_c0_g1_i1.p1 TRINITY_DN24614_c0_g1~~TRINITY_DN24614_c0_g1_i1.p1  ORF type:complete len:320 (+),score=40.29 TRINITY_DN24614_c0_g1_i1:159-1118(+)
MCIRDRNEAAPSESEQPDSSRLYTLPDVPLSPYIPRQPGAATPCKIESNTRESHNQLEDAVSQLDALLLQEPGWDQPANGTQLPETQDPQQVDMIGQKLDQTIQILLNSRQQYSAALQQTTQSQLGTDKERAVPNPVPQPRPPNPVVDSPEAEVRKLGTTPGSILSELQSTTEELGAMLRQGTENRSGAVENRSVALTNGDNKQKVSPEPSESQVRPGQTIQLEVTPEEAALLMSKRKTAGSRPTSAPRQRAPKSGESGITALRVPQENTGRSQRSIKHRAMSTYSHLLSHRTTSHSATLQWEMDLRNSDQPGQKKWRN